jgi:hypothetical protein
MHLVSTSLVAQAYCNWGRWVADCPTGCGNAIALEPKQTQFHCVGGCNALAPVEWPADMDEIGQALQARPIERTRNWAPAGHRQSIACHVPDGQTVADLVAETNEYGSMQ